MIIINKTKNVTLAKEAVLANTLFTRLKGLLGRKSLSPDQALILDPCNSIHTFFMRFSIDVLFVNKQNKVVKTILEIKPFRLSSVYFNAHFAIELPSGAIQQTSTQEGDLLSIE